MSHTRPRFFGGLLVPLLCFVLLAGLVPTPAPAAPAQSVTVPFELIGEHIYLTASLNGKGPYRFVLDTGAYDLIMPEVAQALGLSGRRPEVASVQIGALRLTDQRFTVLPFPDYEKVEGVTPFGGLIGYELFKQYVVKIDYEHHLLTLTPPAQFHYAGRGVVRPLTFAGHIPQIEARLDGASGTFNLDTGDRRSLAIFKNFRGQCRVPLGTPVVAMTGWGVRGPVWSRLGRAETFEIGDCAVRNVVTEFDLPKGGAFDFPHAAGNIGGSILEQFSVTFDYSRRQAIFEKNANFGRPITWDRSGLWLNQDGKTFKVIDVADGSPAAAAGLHVGDRIVAVDGAQAAPLSLPDLRRRLRTLPPGSQFRVRVQSAGGEREAALTLRDLV